MREFPHIEAALEGPVPDLIIAAWGDLAREHTDTGAYASYTSFEKMFPYEGNALSAAVANTSPHARFLEEGHAGFSMPAHVDWSGPHVKTTKDGRRYLTIPMRHATPGLAGVGSGRARRMLPDNVYRDALAVMRLKAQLKQRRNAAVAERLAAAQRRLDAAGPIMSRPYDVSNFPWFSRELTARQRERTIERQAALRDRAMRETGQPGYTWKNRLYEGLTRVTQTNPLTGRESGTYMTFRTMMEDSVGWWIPPVAPARIAAQTVGLVKDQVRELVGEAARADVVTLVGMEIG